MAITALVGALVPVVGNLIDKFIPDPQEAAKAKLEAQSMLMKMEHEELKEAASIIRAEASSDHWLAAVWRPICMLTFLATLVYLIAIAPLVRGIWGIDITPPEHIEPGNIWNLLTIGIGGYVAGRTGEKMIATYKKNGDGS